MTDFALHYVTGSTIAIVFSMIVVAAGVIFMKKYFKD